MLKLIQKDSPCSDGDTAVGHARAPYIFMHLFIQAVWPFLLPHFPLATYQLKPQTLTPAQRSQQALGKAKANAL